MRFISAFIFCALAFSSAYAQRTISSVREYRITEGGSKTIDGVVCTEPDIYYQEKADGTFIANRLTVSPKSAMSDFTQPYLNNSTPNSIQVNWKTSSVDTNGKVLYGTDPDALTSVAYATYTEVKSTHYWNSAVLTGLQPNSIYYYKVVGTSSESEVYRFRSMVSSDDKGKFRILVLGDHQRNERSDYEWLLKAAKRTFDNKYGEKPIEEHVSMLMNIGDQVDSGKIDQYEKVHLYKSREVMSNLPIMTTVGNHERFRDPDLNIYQAHYKSYGDIEYQGIKSNTAFYYAYQSGRVLFVVMNSDGTSNTQRDWVRQVVEAADVDATVDFIVSVQHRPMYAEQWCYDVCPWITNEVMPILSASKKHVINLSGHHHLYARGQMTEWPVYHMITGGGVGTSATDYEQLWGATPDNRDEEAVQKTFDHWTYQIFEFDSEAMQMNVETYSLGNRRLGVDNVLVDSFSRNLNDDSRPATPTMANVTAGTVTLPFTVRQSTDVTGLHSAEYQVAKDVNFTNVVLDRVVTYEDYYGMNSNYTPKNIREGKSIADFVVSNGDLANGSYYVRVRNRNMNLNWSEYSEPMTMTVTGEASLTLNKRFYTTGETITCTYEGAPVGKDAWIGIYQHGQTPGQTDSYAWSYTQNAAGSVTFNVNSRNEYYAVLFKDGGYTEITDRMKFIVNTNCTDETPMQYSTDKLEYEVGEPVVVSFANAPALNKDWIGIYDISVDNPVDGKSHVYTYVGNNGTGSVTLNVPSNNNYTQPLPPGEYYASYFLCDDYTEMFQRQYFKVVEAPTANDATWSFVWDTNRSSGGEGFYNISDHSQYVQVQTLNGLEWTLSSDSYATGFTASSGQYFGSSANPITHGTLSTPYLHGKIKSVSFETKTKDEAQNVQIGVSVGGVPYGDAVTTNTTKTVYTCTPTGEPQEGDIVLTFDQTSDVKSIIYFYSMSIVYEGEGVVSPSVERVSPELSFSPTELTIESGDYTVNPVVNPHNVSGITYSSSDETIALVGVNNGMVVSMGPEGTCTITATFEGDEHYLPQTVSYTLTVVAKPVIAAPTVDVQGGTFDAPVTVTITSDDPLCKAIWYSTTLTSVDDMGYDDATIIVPGKVATVTIDHTCTLLCVAVGDNNIGLPASYDFNISPTNGVTSICENSASAKRVYNLNGQRIKSPMKGLNIVDGKIVLVK